MSTWSECGQRWFLERGVKVPSSTWYATVAGSAIHEVTEALDRAEAKGVAWEHQMSFAPSFASVFDAKLAEVADQGREVKASGRVLKTIGASGGPNKKDREWWYHYGPIFVERWMQWKRSKGWRIAVMPDGSPGIELGFEVDFGLPVPVVGYIDRVYLMADGSVVTCDLKTGKEPSGSLQLITYAAGLSEVYGLDTDWGCFWTPGIDDGGRISPPVAVPDWDMAKVRVMYQQAWRGIASGVFVPQVSALCKGCSVRSSCWAVAGEDSNKIPATFEILDPASGELVTP